MATKEEKALEHANKVWGAYVDDAPSETNAYITMTLGEISQSDYLAGYNQAIEDSKENEMLEFLNVIATSEMTPIIIRKRAKQLIEKASLGLNSEPIEDTVSIFTTPSKFENK